MQVVGPDGHDNEKRYGVLIFSGDAAHLKKAFSHCEIFALPALCVYGCHHEARPSVS